jgi:hypothetical protein
MPEVQVDQPAGIVTVTLAGADEFGSAASTADWDVLAALQEEDEQDWARAPAAGRMHKATTKNRLFPILIVMPFLLDGS